MSTREHQTGDRIRFKSITSEYVFRGTFLRKLSAGLVWVVDGTGLPRPLRADRILP